MSDTPTPQPILLDVMLDLETMGNGPDAAIMAIGAVLFDPIQGTKGANYYAVIDLQSSVNTGGVIDASTVMWWLAQHADARMALVAADTTLHLCAALADFADWIDIHSDRRRVRMWGNGAAFDNVILASAYRRAGIPQPWRYSNDRCYRTIKAQHPDVLMKREGTHHNAIDDARSQAQHLIDMWAVKAAPVAHVHACEDTPSVRLEWASATAAHNARPGPLYSHATPRGWTLAWNECADAVDSAKGLTS